MVIVTRTPRFALSYGRHSRQPAAPVPPVLAFAWVAMLLLSCWGWTAGAQDAVEITVRGNEYVQPAAEMLGTDTYPDIISLAVGDLQATLLPNRGRPLWGLTLPDDEPLLFATATPMPHMGDDGRYSLEFGGLYFSVPWNVRDNQPADLTYTLDQTRGAVVLSGIDSETGVRAEQVVRLDPESSDLTVDVRVTNPADGPVSFPLRVYLLAGPNDTGRRESEVLLPVSSVTVGPNAGWMGPPASEVPWPTPWSRWSSFEGEGEFTAAWPAEAAGAEPSVTVHWPGLSRRLEITWNPADRFGEARFEAFGLTYEDVLGGEPYWRIILEQPEGVPVRLAPGEELRFSLILAVEG